MIPRTPRSALFPYTTLFRSSEQVGAVFPGIPAERLTTGAEFAKLIEPAQTLRTAALAQTSPVDRKSTRLNSSHANISYAVFCLKKTTPDGRLAQVQSTSLTT